MRCSIPNMTEMLSDQFLKVFDCRPEFIVRCPGRVNLIGEHIDYSGYGVLPMALEQSIWASGRFDERNRRVRIKNVNSTYPPFEFEWGSADIDKSNPQWYHYFMCGHRGMCEHLALETKIGLDVLIHGRIPPSAGLSSSSALVCCAAICTLQAATGETFTKLSRTSVAELCAKCERYIGTEGGGMDQAICLLAEEGKVLAKSRGLEWRKIRTLGELQQKLGCGLVEMLEIVDNVLRKEAYSKRAICHTLSVDSDSLDQSSLNVSTQQMTQFQLRNRAVHVFSEAHRVEEFVRICNSDQSMDKLGKLMNESHDSCSTMYQCSCPDLDELVSVCRESGAVGSRLTGAGWGGCTVSLVLAENVQNFLDSVKEKFYKKTQHRLQYLSRGAVFVTKPAAGSSVQIF